MRRPRRAHALSRSSFVFVAVGLTGVAASGCRGCKNDKPYVPYTIDGTSLPSSSAPSAAPPPSAPPPFDGGTFARVAAQAAPPGTSTWSLGGLSIAAPPGRIFSQGLVLSSHGDPPAVAAFVGDGGSLAGELVIYRSDAGGRVIGPTTLARLPEWMPQAQGCQHVTTLSQIGESTLWLDVIATCEKHEPKRLHRYVAAVSTSGTGGVRADFRGAELPPAERVVIDADASDRDGDGVDDLAIQITLEGALTPLVGNGRASATLHFLGRTQGLSRDTQEPGKSLRQSSSWFAQLSAKKGSAEEAMLGARQTLRLFELLCSEGGSPSFVQGDGSPFACGDTATVEDAFYAEARAALSAGDVARAFTQAARLRAAKPKSKRAQDLDAAIEADAKPKIAHARPLKVTPVDSSIALPLAFDADDGALFVQGTDGTVRVDPSGNEAPAKDPRSWSPKALLVGDLKVTGETDSCRADPVGLSVTGGGEKRSLPVGILGSTAPICPAPAPLFLLDRNADGLVALVEGVPVSVNAAGDSAAITAFPQGLGALGSVRSPNGKFVAIAAGDRVLVRGPDHAEVWRPQPFFTLDACTVANDGKSVACILDHGAVILSP